MRLMELFVSPQGEGSLVGQVTCFLRFGGCNLACVHPDTLVTMADFTQRPISQIREGDEILGIQHLPPNRQKLVKQKVKKVWTTQKPGYLVEYEKGQLVCSEDHRIYSSRRHGYADAGKCDGSYGKFISARNKQLTNEYKKGYLSGAIYGDGWIGQTSYLREGNLRISRAFNFVVKDKAFAKRITKYGNALGFQIMKPVSCRDKYWRVSSNNTQFMDLVREYDKKSEEANFDFSNEEFFRGFCAGFFDAEGCWEGSNNGLIISQTTDLRLMKIITKKLSQFNARLLVSDAPHVLSGEAFRIIIGSTKDAFDFVMWCNPAIKRKWRIFTKNFPSRRVLMKVSKEPVYDGILYDIQTETENFFANGLLVHNCIWCDEPDSVPLHTQSRPRPKAELKTPAEILKLVEFQKVRHICLTGGEPLIQPVEELEELCRALHIRNHFISVETNATRVVPSLLPYVKMWTFSPKLSSSDNNNINHNVIISNMRAIRDDEKRIGKMQLKFVIGNVQDVLDLKKYLDAFPTVPVYIQSVWNEESWSPVYTVQELETMFTNIGIDFKNNTIRFGVQLHKYLNVK